jgi:hypothetical protein
MYLDQTFRRISDGMRVFVNWDRANGSYLSITDDIIIAYGGEQEASFQPVMPIQVSGSGGDTRMEMLQSFGPEPQFRLPGLHRHSAILRTDEETGDKTMLVLFGWDMMTSVCRDGSTAIRAKIKVSTNGVELEWDILPLHAAVSGGPVPGAMCGQTLTQVAPNKYILLGGWNPASQTMQYTTWLLEWSTKDAIWVWSKIIPSLGDLTPRAYHTATRIGMQGPTN